MADVTVSVDKSINKAISFTITPDGALDGVANWVKDSGNATMVAAQDGLSARFTWEGNAGDDNVQFHVEADNDLAPGVVNLLKQTGELVLTAGGGGGGTPATALNLAAGTPEPIGNAPPTNFSRRRGF